jgi:hypothetical protein
MAKKFLTGLQLLNLTSDPATGIEGELYYNTINDVVKIYSNGSWKNIPSGNLVTIDSIESPDYITFDTTPESSSASVGTMSWNANDATLDLKLSNDVTLQVGQELHVRAHNSSGSTIYNGTVVYINGASDEHGHISIAPYIADGSVNVFNVMGLVTADILNGADGYVTLSGLVRGLDTSMFTAGDSVFASDTIPGGLTTIQPLSPSETVSLGVVTVSDSTNGTIFVQIDTGATADLVTYDNNTSLLTATNVEAAIDELALTKADVNSIASNIVLYPTTASATSLSGYYKLVSSVDDAAYNDIAVNIPTGDLSATGQNHLIASLSADANLFVGSPGSINITTVGNIRKTSGNSNAYSEFFFRIYKRNAAGAETLIGTSSTTGAVNPTILNQYAQFSAAGNFLLTNFLDTDRLVIKYYSNTMDAGTQTYEFQFGGDQPVRTLLPLPISVLASNEASGISVDTSTFNGVLSGYDSTVQHALETIDDIITIPNQDGNSNKFLKTTGSSLQWETIDLNSTINTASAAAYASASAYTNSQINALTTTDIEEGTNLYFTNQRAINAGSATYILQTNQQGIINSASAAAVTAVLDGAPGALDTLNELAAALGDDANFATTVTNSLSGKLDISTASSTYLTQAAYASASPNFATDAELASAIVTASAAAASYIDTEISSLTTSDIEEGSNLYYTDVRALNSASTALVHGNHNNIVASYNSASSQIILSASVSSGAAIANTDLSQPNANSNTGLLYFNPNDFTFSIAYGGTWLQIGAASSQIVGGSASTSEFTNIFDGGNSSSTYDSYLVGGTS